MKLAAKAGRSSLKVIKRRGWRVLACSEVGL